MGKAAATKDYTALIPPPPADLLLWLENRRAFTDNWLVFSCGWTRDPVVATKERCLHVRCTACGGAFDARRLDDDADVPCHHAAYGRQACEAYTGLYGDVMIKHRHKVACPLCGATAMGMHVSRVPHEAEKSIHPMVVGMIASGEPYAAAYCVTRRADKSGDIHIDVRKYEAYVFLPRKAVRLAGFVQGLGYHIDWQQRVRFYDNLGSVEHVYCATRQPFKGTHLENSRFRQYLRAGGAHPIGYLHLFAKKPQVENLVVQGCTHLVDAVINQDAYHKNIDLAQKSPRRMLGLAKPDFEAARTARLGPGQLGDYRALRGQYPKETPDDLAKMVTQMNTWSFDRMVKRGDSVPRVWRYLCKMRKKCRYTSIAGAQSHWDDYLRMAEQLGYDTADAAVRLPGNLRRAHDRLVGELNARREELAREKARAREEAFAKMTALLLPLAYEKDGLLIRPAESEADLRAEGKALGHCVGGYGQTHCDGRPIFFIRKASAPDAAYFTLQLDIKEKRIAQNLGKGNRRPPPDVTAFAEAWLAEVVKRYDFVKGAFKQKKARVRVA